MKELNDYQLRKIALRRDARDRHVARGMARRLSDELKESAPHMTFQDYEMLLLRMVNNYDHGDVKWTEDWMRRTAQCISPEMLHALRDDRDTIIRTQGKEGRDLIHQFLYCETHEVFGYVPLTVRAGRAA